MSGFGGFPKGGDRFFHELGLEQSREWFHAHKEDYERLWQAPMAALLDELHAALTRVYRPRKLAPPKIFRIQRDVRFSKDKSPYKTQISGILTLASKGERVMESPAALYVHFGTEQIAAAGAYVLDGEALARYRAAVVDPKKGAALAKIVAALEAVGGELGAHTTLAKVPRGFDPEHPRAALLKRKGLMVSFPAAPAKLLASPKLVGHLVEQGASAKPLLEWLMKNAL